MFTRDLRRACVRGCKAADRITLPPRMLCFIACASAMSLSNLVLAQKEQRETPPAVVQPGAPGEPSRKLPPSTRATVPPIAAADVAFMQGIVMHHGQAVAITALIPSHTDNQSVRTLGAKISSSQTDEMQFMKRWLAARGESVSTGMPGMPEMDRSGHAMAAMPGMLTQAQMRALEKARGAEFDRLFLTGMIQHHNGALTMVQDLFNTAGAGQDADLFNFATDADNTQRAEINIMQGMLKKEQ